MTQGKFTNGLTTQKAAAAISRGQLLKFGTEAGTVTPCAAATDVAMFIALDSAEAGQRLACAVLGNAEGTQLVKATAVIKAGDPVNPLGAISATGAVTVGRALEGAAAGELVNIAHAAARTL